MKKVLYSLIVVGLLFFGTTFAVSAQDLRSNQVPSAVVNSFNKQFPQASDIDWEQENSNYEVEFEVGRLDHLAIFNSQGEIIRHKQELRVRDLPEQIRQEVKNAYRGYRISEVDKLTQGEQVYFKLELKNWTKELDIVVDSSGQQVEGFIW